MDHPRRRVHYPGSTGQFQAWFGTDADCLDYLEWLRWPEGFACPRCGSVGGWRLDDGRFLLRVTTGVENSLVPEGLAAVNS